MTTITKSNRLVNSVARTPKVHNVEIVSDCGCISIYQNGEEVGRVFLHGWDSYMSFKNPETGRFDFAATCKTLKSTKQKAYTFAFSVLERMTTGEYFAARAVKDDRGVETSPFDIQMKAMGYADRMEFTNVMNPR